jgi:hypothetical protein
MLDKAVKPHVVSPQMIVEDQLSQVFKSGQPALQHSLSVDR